MFKINLSPFFSETEKLEVEKKGEALIINGETFDFTPLTEGSEIAVLALNSPYFSDTNKLTIARVNNVVEVTLKFPHPTTASDKAKYPEPILVEADGKVVLPE